MKEYQCVSSYWHKQREIIQTEQFNHTSNRIPCEDKTSLQVEIWSQLGITLTALLLGGACVREVCVCVCVWYTCGVC
jgi:hypothetical protein